MSGMGRWCRNHENSSGHIVSMNSQVWCCTIPVREDRFETHFDAHKNELWWGKNFDKMVLPIGGLIVKILARGKQRDHGVGTIFSGDIEDPKVNADGLVEFQFTGSDKNRNSNYVYTILLSEADVDKLAKQAARSDYELRLRALEKKFKEDVKELKNLPELKSNYNLRGQLIEKLRK